MQTQYVTGFARHDALLAELTMLDFMLVDLALYLNIHQHEAAALEKYDNIARRADTVRSEYEKTAGPLCSFRSKAAKNRWNWADQPWPWLAQANFEFTQ